ncbi:CaiB/BaiF CoA transferase family protein [Ralstonia insidiosa]|uniref:CaiB/BaiF CoA transferase family protein n=1 Tax=Ralstonia insidiosa TaxID=190721 RepID=UPI000CEE1DCC|nr:CoA transferase [Ralstonia insidiosa]
MNHAQLHDAALKGVRVIDLTTVVFGPYATQTLADYGADVIKIETPEGDSMRHNGPAHERGMASIYLGSNRNKRSVVLDLKTAAAREALLALCDTADVFIHNIRPQKLAKLGVSAEVLRERNPRLIFVGLVGFGEGGPYAGAPAYDDIIQALSGASDLVMRQTGAPGYFPTVAADKISALMAVQAVTAALYQRERTGRGQVIEVPMFEAMTSFLMVEHFYQRQIQPSEGPTPADRGQLGYPRSVDSWRRPYRTANGHACIMPYTDENWRRFFAAVERPDLAADTRFQNMAGRSQHIGALLEEMAGILEAQTTEYWIDLCTSLEIPCARLNRLEDLEADPHLQAVGFFESLPFDTGTRFRFARAPIRMSDSYVAPTVPPRLGQHTEEVLQPLGLPDTVLQAVLARTHTPESTR